MKQQKQSLPFLPLQNSLSLVGGPSNSLGPEFVEKWVSTFIERVRKDKDDRCVWVYVCACGWGGSSEGAATHTWGKVIPEDKNLFW